MIVFDRFLIYVCSQARKKGSLCLFDQQFISEGNRIYNRIPAALALQRAQIKHRINAMKLFRLSFR